MRRLWPYDSFIKGFNLDGSMPEDGFRRLLDDSKRIMKIDREVALREVTISRFFEKRKGNWESNKPGKRQRAGRKGVENL
jgi:hypothetical protein